MTAHAIKRWLDRALALVYPDLCQVCREQPATISDGYVCDICRTQVRFIIAPFCGRCGLPFDGDLSNEFECTNCRELELHFDQARSAVLARGVTLEVIHRYKYRQAMWFEPFLADLLITRAAPALIRQQWNMIMPVPLHAVRERERGFNQAARLARRLGAATRIPVCDNVLVRVRPTPTQTTLKRNERLQNMQTAFIARPSVSIHGKSIVLVDDVFTTGATTSACARMLRTLGATTVCVWTVARGI